MWGANTWWVLIAPETTEDEETEDSEEKKPKTKTIKETTSEWELLNDVKAVWLRSPKEVTEEEYSKFYHSLAKVYILWWWIHY
jgi:heat shock protein 90kDa beta